MPHGSGGCIIRDPRVDARPAVLRFFEPDLTGVPDHRPLDAPPTDALVGLKPGNLSRPRDGGPRRSLGGPLRDPGLQLAHLAKMLHEERIIAEVAPECEDLPDGR